MYESYAEVISSYIGQMMGLNILEYRLCRVSIDNQYVCIACESDIFINENEHYISIAKLMLNNLITPYYINDISGLNGLLNELSNITGFKEYLIQTILLDYIILNSDRHYGNLGLIVNNNGLYRTAPIFDNGSSMFSDKYIENMKYETSLCGYISAKPFNRNFDIQLRQLINFTNSKELVCNYINKLNIAYINRKIDSLIKYGLTENRAKFIKDLIKDRIYRIKSLIV